MAGLPQDWAGLCFMFGNLCAAELKCRFYQSSKDAQINGFRYKIKGPFFEGIDSRFHIAMGRDDGCWGGRIVGLNMFNQVNAITIG